MNYEKGLMILIAALCSFSAMAQRDFVIPVNSDSEAVVLPRRNLRIGAVPYWKRGTAYAAGDYFATQANQFYLVHTAGTSGTSAPTGEGAAVTNGTLVAGFVPPGPRSGFAIVNTGTNNVDLVVGEGDGGIRLWPRGSWSDGGPACPQAEIRVKAVEGPGEVRGCTW